MRLALGHVLVQVHVQVLSGLGSLLDWWAGFFSSILVVVVATAVEASVHLLEAASLVDAARAVAIVRSLSRVVAGEVVAIVLGAHASNTVLVHKDFSFELILHWISAIISESSETTVQAIVVSDVGSRRAESLSQVRGLVVEGASVQGQSGRVESATAAIFVILDRNTAGLHGRTAQLLLLLSSLVVEAETLTDALLLDLESGAHGRSGGELRGELSVLGARLAIIQTNGSGSVAGLGHAAAANYRARLRSAR